MLMDLDTLSWDEEIAGEMGIPLSMLPEIRSSSEVYGEVPPARHPRRASRSPGILGDQQAATFGQACFAGGEAKNTYGTGNFVLLNTGTEQVHERERPAHHGLLQDRRRRRRSTRWRARSPSPARWCSGCATTSA